MLVARHALDDLLGAIQVTEERQRRGSGTEGHDSDTIGGQQLIDEPLHRFHHRRAAAEIDVGLIHGDHDQPAVAHVFVGGIALGNRCGARPFRILDNRHPFGAEHAPVLAVDLDVEIATPKAGDRLAGVVDDGDVEERRHIDGCLEAGRLILGSSRSRDEGENEHQPQNA